MFFFAFCGGARIRPDLVQPWFVVVIVHFLIDRFHCLRFASDPLIETFSPYMSFKLLTSMFSWTSKFHPVLQCRHQLFNQMRL